jgi:hypothetical protein
MNIEVFAISFQLHFPSYWEAIGVVTPENKKLNFG